MRVVFATDRIGPLASSVAGAALATGWQQRRPQDELVVVPLGSAGAGLAEAYADLVGTEVELSPQSYPGAGDDLAVLLRVEGPEVCLVGVDRSAPDPQPGLDVTETVTSAPWGEAIALALDGAAGKSCGGGGDRALVVDLAGCRARDAGAGLLAALGAVADVSLDRGPAGLAKVSSVDLSAVRDRLAGFTGLVAIVPVEESDRELLGMRGVTSLHGVALREAGLAWDPAELLAADATLARFVDLVAPELSDRPGLGACGGAAYVLTALGARITTGPEWLAERTDLRTTLAAADLVITGTGAYDFAHRGGETVEAVVRMAGEAMRPVVAVAGVVTISAREMRAYGLEAAYALHDAPPGATVAIEDADLVAMGRRLARSWTA